MKKFITYICPALTTLLLALILILSTGYRTIPAAAASFAVESFPIQSFLKSFSGPFSVEYNNNILIRNNYFPVTELNLLNNPAQGEIYFPADRGGRFLLDWYSKDSMIIKPERLKIYAGYTRLSEETFNMDRDTILFFAERSSGQEYTKGRYNLDMESYLQKMQGVILGGELLTSGPLSLDFKLKLLAGTELNYRRYQGQILEQNGSYYMSGWKKIINDTVSRQVEALGADFSSNGYSLSAGLKWHLTENLSLKFTAEDFYSAILWKDLYTENMSYNRHSISFNTAQGAAAGAQGSLTTSGDPAQLNGIDGEGHYHFTNYRTQLTPRYNLEIQGKRLAVGLFYKKGLYPHINYALLTAPVNLRAGLCGRLISLKVTCSGLDLELAADRLDLSAASELNCTLTFNRTF